MTVDKLVINLGDLIVMEPIVSLTDIIVSIACFVAFYKLYKKGQKGRMYLHFKLHFFSMGLATLFGGLIGHAFIYAFSEHWKLVGWLISMVSINFLERAFIAHTMQYLSEKTRFYIKTANNIELLVFMVLTIYSLDFFYVEIHTGFGLLAVIFPAQLFMYIKTKEKEAKNVFVVVALSVVSAIVFINQIGAHKWFNHIAISHVFMFLMVIFLYRSASKLNYDRELESKERKIFKVIPKVLSWLSREKVS